MQKLLFLILAVIAVEFRVLRWLYSLFRPMILYICGALTELPEKQKEKVKELYTDLANVAAEVLGRRGFVPHENYDPEKHRHYTPLQVFLNEVFQVIFCTSRLVVVAVAPSWGGGMEVMMAYFTGIPVDILCERSKLEAGLISRLLRGGPGVNIIGFEGADYEDAVSEYRMFLRREVQRKAV